MATTIKLKNGSGAPLAGDLVAGEPALDLTNKRLYTEDSGGTVIEVGTNPGASGAVTLNHSGNAKLATTSTGIDVTGTVTADGLTVDGDASINRATLSDTASDPALEISARTDSSNLDFKFTDTDGSVVVDQVHHKSEYYATDGTQVSAKVRTEYADVSGGMNYVISTSGAGVAVRDRLKIGSGGDISFYEDTGTTAKLFWDASAESLGIGTSSPTADLSVGSIATSSGDIHLRTTKTAASITPSNTDAGGLDIGVGWVSGGQGPMTFTIGSTEAVRIDSSGNVKIGTATDRFSFLTASTANLQIDGGVVFDPGSGNNVEIFNYRATDMLFGNSGSEAMRIDSSGNVGIGVTPESWNTYKTLQIGNGAIANYSPTHDMRIVSNAYYNSGWKYAESDGACLYLQDGDNSTHVWSYAASGTADAALTWSEAMRIDSSGNLLVGKTSLGIGVTGSEIRANGQLLVTADGDNPADFNRKTSDGTIALFRQDSTTVGSIGVGDSDNLYITGGAGSTKGLIFTDDRIIAGANGYNFQDDNTTLGHPSYRFKDLYLSGGAYLGGTGSANKLDDYEEGTWTPTLTGSTTAPSTTQQGTGTYTKVGNLVIVEAKLSNKDVTGVSGNWTVTGLPFTSNGTAQGTAWSGRVGSSTDMKIAYINSSNEIILVNGDGNALAWATAGTGTYAAVTIAFMVA